IAVNFDGELIQQGISAELLAVRHRSDHATLDAFAAASHRRAAKAARRCDGPCRSDATVAVEDETVHPGITPSARANLKPAFFDAVHGERFSEIAWRLTPSNSSSLTDEASAVLIMSSAMADHLGLRPYARSHSSAVVGSDPLT